MSTLQCSRHLVRTESFESVEIVTKEVEVNFHPAVCQYQHLFSNQWSCYFVQPFKPRPLPQYFISQLQMDRVHWAEEAVDTDGMKQKQCGQRQISCQHRLFAKHTPERGEQENGCKQGWS